jgi:hypothetical protein
VAAGGGTQLVFSSRDTVRNNALALRDYLESKLKRKRTRRRAA